jgi:phospho-N-acetylmuramoyl-pentapeptide-transferase
VALYLGFLIFAFIVTGILTVPFINLLYRLRVTYHHPIKALTEQEAKEFNNINKEQKWKIGTPIGGGLLIIFLVCLLYLIIFPFISRLGITVTSVFPVKEELNILFFTFISFGLLGLYDDIIKIFNLSRPGFNSGYWPSRKTVFVILLSFFVALTLYLNIGIHIINLPLFGVVKLGWAYVPLAAVIISAFCKAYDVTDGLDGLAGGVLLICLLAFWGLSVAALDTILSVFIALWIGGLLAFLYFNVYPARIWLGNAGSLSFGATLAVIGLILGKSVALLLVGFVFLIEGASQIIQILSLKFFKKKVFSVTPVHYWLAHQGWTEPKIVMRLWLLAILSAMVGLWFANF